MRFSIIIPTLNENRNISSCVRSVIENSVFKDSERGIEIIIVDGGSKDNTLKRASEFDNEINIRIVKTGEASLPGQLNEGASIAKGNILVFLHADCR
ncbi:unnamed protein product, partial [marine sediment metagenome]